MNACAGRRRKKEPIPPPGDDVVPAPAPVKEEPPHDRFCDLVLTGGVASGVVYPWAIIELARAFRFRNIGGTSVGAMAAALAAAAEYGRRTGFEAPFEALRRAPASLAQILPDGRTRMLSLFQTNAHGERLIDLWGRFGRGLPEGQSREQSRCPERGALRRAAGLAAFVYWRPLALGALGGAVFTKGVAFLLLGLPPGAWPAPWILLVGLVTLLAALLSWACAMWSDIQLGVIENFYGLCRGATVERPGHDDKPGLSDWLHEGIQASAGLKDDEPPLTFRDLWSAPAYPGALHRPCDCKDPADRRAIDLQVITTNVTHGRPYRLPLTDMTSRLFFRPTELQGYFPPCVLEAMVAASHPYAPHDRADPSLTDEQTQGLLELPREDLPVVVAARLSLSFPLLFSAVPLWAIDYEAPPGERLLRRCLFTDGGVSSNFPIHLFDAAVPRWPTFGLWLDRRPPYHYKERDGESDEEVWLPRYNRMGWGDSWDRFDPESKPPRSASSVCCPEAQPRSCAFHWQLLVGFLAGIGTSAKDWRDRTSFRLPHVRNRVARIFLLPGEGGLHIGMPRKQILDMAHRYGTLAGRKFVVRFADRHGQASPAWSEQRWIRFNLLVNGLRERLDGLGARAAWSAHTVPLQDAIARAVKGATTAREPVADRGDCHKIGDETADALSGVLRELGRLEDVLQAAPPAFHSPPEPELRLRPPL
jgi:predicted acylesterase/phospholipase RssA